MHILCLGINHTTAPLEIREKLSFSETSARSALARLGCWEGLAHVSELVLLSTCNRTELYAASSQPGFEELEAFLAEVHSTPVQEFHTHLYRYRDEQVVHHLYRVVAGLDSLVLGEPQILGQATRALELALGVGACGAVLSRLFRSAIHTGKRAHTETAISRNPASVSSLAAALAAREVKHLAQARVAVVGAGEMAELAVEALRKRGATGILVVNRTLERARALAQRWQAQAYTFEQLEQVLEQADIVISSTSAPHPVINAGSLAELMPRRPQRPLALIDIAVPRDIDPDVRHISGVKLFDMDALEQQVRRHLAERTAETPAVEAILAEEEARFHDYLATLDMLPLVSSLRQQAEAIRQAEVERTLRRMPGLNPAQRQRIEALSRALVKKILHTPTHRLHIEANCPHAAEYATVARTLFDLPGEPLSCAFSKQACPLSPPDASQPVGLFGEKAGD